MYVKTIFDFKLIQSEEQWRKTWRTKKKPQIMLSNVNDF